ncbi:DNA-directed RNA polymerase II subunit rpb4 [Neolecta irregularis DAH-3]|uniref:DNA-directed RNA polymerase II subunit rpb4 n=1 Tax=Neolecta irregularis (strain DAH-3) TaxID=1198029 RepID=A0A1U7LRA0_NEOID|nr:DNA-directed RNA polymerase II subunit rpb4 [Neolecta irregularis DAH-3]|eukprot:OLL25200.1 DNA-directed RNA polymerase II subunit rpb4 [Neolecta irregularis DAH-3]
MTSTNHSSLPRHLTKAAIHQEDASELSFGLEFENSTCLTLSEAKVILEEVLKTRRKDQGRSADGDDMEGLTLLSSVTKKTKDYLDQFARFKTSETVAACENIIRNPQHELHSFEQAQLGSLCPEESDEAKTLIPSLGAKVTDESLDALLDNLTSLRRFQV